MSDSLQQLDSLLDLLLAGSTETQVLPNLRKVGDSKCYGCQTENQAQYDTHGSIQWMAGKWKEGKERRKGTVSGEAR